MESMEESNWKIQFAVGFAVSVASMSAGVAYSWTTPVIPKFHNNESGFVFSDKEISWLAVSNIPGVLVGTVVSRYPCDHFGRRFTILSSIAPIFAGSMIILFTTKLWLICLGRIITSVGSCTVQIRWQSMGALHEDVALTGRKNLFKGILSSLLGIVFFPVKKLSKLWKEKKSVSMIYAAEVASKEKRGIMAAALRFMYNFGLLVQVTIGSFVSYQNLNLMVVVLPFTYFLACWWIPESPYYLLKEGKIVAARKELMKLNGSTVDQIQDQKLIDLRKHVKEDMRRSSTLYELLRGKRYRKALLIAIGLRVFQGLSGPIPIQLYIGRIMQDIDSSISVNTGLITYGALKFFFSMMSSTLVDKVGRRPLLIYSFIGGFLSLSIVGSCFIVRESITLKDYPHLFGNVIFSGIMCFNIISTVGYDTIALVIAAEIFPLNVKSIAMSWIMLFGSAVTFVIVKGYQLVKDLGGLQTVFLFFGSTCLLGVIFSYCLVPETRGKSLRDIQIQLQGPLYNESEEKESMTQDEGTLPSQEENMLLLAN